MFIIQLKRSANPEAMNAKLEALYSKHRFNSETENQDWLDDINNNPESPQAHLKPKGKDLSMEDLTKTFPKDTKVGLMQVDCSYSRLDKQEAVKLAKFITKNKNAIHFLRNANDFIEKAEITNRSLLNLLNDLNRRRLPLLERPEDMRDQLPESGIVLVKTWGLQKAWLLFGNVEKNRPVWMKENKYIRKSANRLHTDKEGRGFLLMPLYDFSPNFADVVSKAAWEMSIREHPNFLLNALYGEIFTIQDIKGTAESFAEFYTIEELIERFAERRKAIAAFSPISNYDDNGISFVGTNRVYRFKANNKLNEGKAAFLNTLMLSVELATNKETAYQVLEGFIKAT